MRSPRIKRSVAGVMAAGLIFAACGGSDDTSEATTPAADEAPADTEAKDDGGGAGLALEGDVEVAVGTTLNLGECPDDWSATQGVDGDEIRVGWTGPQSGALAAFGAIGEGMQMYFDFINETDQIDGKDLTLIAKDDGYEAGRAVANVEEMIDSDDIFAFAHVIGTPINLAIRPITDEACVPQLLNSTGFPFWGDPANFPWTVGNILNYATETNFWCQAVKEEFPDGATVATLIMNNDFGKTYQNTLAGSADCEGIELVEEQLHDPAGADVSNEMTTLAASGADIFIAGTTAKFCTQTIVALSQSDWRPTTFMSYTCNNLASFVDETGDAIEALGDSSPIMANSNLICGDPSVADDPAILETERILAEYGDVTCLDGSFSTGVLYGELIVDMIRSASEMEGGLNRVNMMAATWNADVKSDLLLGGSNKLNGVEDAYFTEAAQLQQVVLGPDGPTFESRGELIDLEGQGGSYVAP